MSPVSFSLKVQSIMVSLETVNLYLYILTLQIQIQLFQTVSFKIVLPKILTKFWQGLMQKLMFVLECFHRHKKRWREVETRSFAVFNLWAFILTKRHFFTCKRCLVYFQGICFINSVLFTRSNFLIS